MPITRADQSTRSLMPMRPGSDNARVLDLLRWMNGWVDYPYRRLPVMWHSRVAELRRRGYEIECRRVVNADSKPDYQYRLVTGEK